MLKDTQLYLLTSNLGVWLVNNMKINPYIKWKLHKTCKWENILSVKVRRCLVYEVLDAFLYSQVQNIILILMDNYVWLTPHKKLTYVKE